MDKIGKYLIQGKLGQGGMGVVYKALDPLLERTVALKTIWTHLDSEPSLRARFFREGRSAAQLSHKSIITVYDLGEDNGMAYMAMEFLEGEDLKKKIASREPFSLQNRLLIMQDICEGLAHAHSRQIIHRDIKPANIFLTSSGQIKILDFGLARIASSEMTRTGIPLGTPNYMSPEQARGEKLDQRTDIFSAGALFYELLTFKKPFDADSVHGTILKILEKDPEPPENIDPSIHPRLSAIVRKALAKHPSARYQTVLELSSDLKDYVADLSGQPAPAAGGRELRPALLSPGNASMQTAFAEPTAATLDTAAKDEPWPDRKAKIHQPTALTSRSGSRLVAYGLVAVMVLVTAVALLWRLRWDRAPQGTPTGAAEASGEVHAPSVSAHPAPPAESAAAPQRTPDPQAVSQDPSEPLPRSAERGGMVKPGNKRAEPPAAEGKSGETAARAGDASATTASGPEARQLAAKLESVAAKSAADALEQMAQARRRAEGAGAAQYAAKTFEAARGLEKDARRLYDARRFADAGPRLIDAGGLYLRASIEAESERLTEENRARSLEAEHQKTLLREQAQAGRNAFERERSKAASAEASVRAPQEFQDAIQAASEAQAKWDREDYAGSRSDFERAASLMQLAEAAALEASAKPEVPAPDVASKSAPAGPPPANSAQSAQQAVSTVLQRYVACLQARDIRTLKSIWPGLGEQQEKAIREEFTNAREIRVQLTGIEIKIAGDTATASARRSYEIFTADGQRLQTDTRMATYLRWSGDAWLIEKISFEPLR